MIFLKPAKIRSRLSSLRKKRKLTVRNTIDGVLNFNGVPEQNYPPLFTAFDTKWDECFDVVAEDAYETGIFILNNI